MGSTRPRLRRRRWPKAWPRRSARPGNRTVVAPSGSTTATTASPATRARLVIVDDAELRLVPLQDAGYRAIGEKLAARLAEVRASGIELAAEAVKGPPRATASARRSRSTHRRCRR